MHIFEQPCPAGWVYPCTLEDITNRLAELPADDCEGLWAVGLAASTRKDWSANGRYFFLKKPAIHIYSYRDTLQVKLLPHTKQADITSGFVRELEYGMTVGQHGSRFICHWTAENLRRFMLNHVLAHEVGHHVYHRWRAQQGFDYCPNWRESEQFAEAYAVRHCTGKGSKG